MRTVETNNDSVSALRIAWAIKKRIETPPDNLREMEDGIDCKLLFAFMLLFFPEIFLILVYLLLLYLAVLQFCDLRESLGIYCYFENFLVEPHTYFSYLPALLFSRSISTIFFSIACTDFPWWTMDFALLFLLVFLSLIKFSRSNLWRDMVLPLSLSPFTFTHVIIHAE